LASLTVQTIKISTKVLLEKFFRRGYYRSAPLSLNLNTNEKE